MERRRFTTGTILAAVLWLACGAYASQFAYRGWVPHDEGTIGQTAERVLSGQVPHRDFDDVYTGGLTYLHAASMKMLGVTLQAPRLTVFAFFMAFLAATYAIGRRIASAPAALAGMALATVWSLPNYFVSLPSWYNLFFATFGILAFLYYLDTDRRRWLVAAGVCGGFSVLAKISGVFYLAGGLLFLAFVEQTRARQSTLWNREGAGLRLVWAIAAAAGLGLFVSLLSSGAIDSAFLTVVAPALLVCLFLAWDEWTSGSGGVRDRAGRLWSLYWPFLAGAALPLMAFVLLYWQHNALADLVRGIFILPQRRLGEAAWHPPSMATWGLAAPYAALLLTARRNNRRTETLAAGVLAILLGAALLFGHLPSIHGTVSVTARAMTMMAVVAGVWMLARRPASAQTPESASIRMRMFLLLAMAAMVSLVQVPYATPTYFFYAAPLSILAIVALIFSQAQTGMKLHWCVAAFFFIFAIVFVNRSYVGYRDVNRSFAPYPADATLDLERGGLRVPAEDADTYERVVHLLQTHAGGGTIYAGPDCPEIYFLSGFPNPTRSLFDFLTLARHDASWLADLLNRAPVRAVVINTASVFSPPLDPEVVALLERRFPSSERVGRFVVRFQ